MYTIYKPIMSRHHKTQRPNLRGKGVGRVSPQGARLTTENKRKTNMTQCVNLLYIWPTFTLSLCHKWEGKIDIEL